MPQIIIEFLLYFILSTNIYSQPFQLWHSLARQGCSLSFPLATNTSEILSHQYTQGYQCCSVLDQLHSFKYPRRVGVARAAAVKVTLKGYPSLKPSLYRKTYRYICFISIYYFSLKKRRRVTFCPVCQL